MDKSFMPKAFTSHELWHSSILETVKLKDTTSGTSINPTRLLYSYDNAFHGFSAVMSEDELQFLGLNPESGLWPASDYGEDVIVGVIDTGVWPESRSCMDDGMTEIPSMWKGICEPGQEFNASMCNNKLIGVQYFNKGVKAAYPNTTISMNSDRDTQGHGTHTSSTVGGNYVESASFFGYATGTARGVAPRARLAIYKVIWDEGRFASDVFAGMDQAVADGVDVISVSLGFDNVPLYEDPVAIASFGAMEKGILVSASAGTVGGVPGGLHNGIPWLLTTAAGSIGRVLSGKLTLGNGQVITGWSTSSHLSATSQYRVAIQLPYPTSIMESSYAKIPEDGAAVISYAKSSANPVASISFQQTIVRSTPAPVVATYSLRGPLPSYPGILKPHIMAPGSLVLASWIPNVNTALIYPDIGLSSEFTMISGTSMACPHSSGIAALLIGAHILNGVQQQSVLQ
ncbi:hypothetical protein KY285_022461 [Solanum tuberosum]|nr:hypothetical protein KY289_022674 [Solanum tuberosum]KAH0695364.1 hypothetical protein KY285_022461 [Solanum tuberosum]